MTIRRTQGPAFEPLSLTDAKLYLRVDVDDDDTLISALISGAREFAENYTRRSFIQQSWKLVIDSFPGPDQFGVPWGRPFTTPSNAFVLERSPTAVVTGIKYLDMSYTSQVVDPTTYIADYASEPCRVTPIFGQIWPIPQPQIASIEVDFVAGWAAPITFSNGQMVVSGIWTPYNVGDPVELTNVGGALPSELTASRPYFIQSVVSPGVYTLAATPGGPAITFSDTGTGNSLVGSVPAGIINWMKLRIGSLYENRGEVVIPERGTVQELPYVNRLLDPYAVIT